MGPLNEHLQAEQALPLDQGVRGAPEVGHIVLKQAPLQRHQPVQHRPDALHQQAGMLMRVVGAPEMIMSINTHVAQQPMNNAWQGRQSSSF